MTKREAKRQAYRYVLGVLSNFGESWSLETRRYDSETGQKLELAMEKLIDVLERGGTNGRAQRQAADGEEA